MTALAASDSVLYAGGLTLANESTRVNHIARWDDARWDSLGAGLERAQPGGFYVQEGVVNDIVLHDSDVYAAGSFARAGGRDNSGYAARWDGERWHALGDGLRPDSSCYVRNDGSVSSGPYGAVASLTTHDGDLYAGGCFRLAGSESVHNAARWDGSSWTALGGQGAESVNAFTVYDGDPYLATGHVIESRLLRWNGAEWETVARIERGAINDLMAAPSGLVAAGRFDEIGGRRISNVARWDGEQWRAYDYGVYDEVHDLAPSPDGLLAGGGFNGGGFAARWRKGRWRRLVSHKGIGGAEVEALATDGLDTYVGGRFAWAGRVPARNMARWDGFRWHALGKGTDGAVRTISVVGVDSAGGEAVGGAARWDGSSWSALSGPRKFRAVAADGETTYALFDVDDTDEPCVELARRGTARWRIVGEPVCLADGDLPAPVRATGPVEGFIAQNGRAYLTNVTLPDDTLSSSLAAWNGDAWEALGASEKNESVGRLRGIAASEGNIFATGYRVYRWESDRWASLGETQDLFQQRPRITNNVAVGPTGVFVGGAFRSVGGVRSSLFAHWRFANASRTGDRAASDGDWQLTPPAPNPFRRSARLALYAPEAADVRVAVYDALGRRVAVLRDGPQPAGLQRVTWRPEGAAAGGTYFVRMTTEGGLVRTQAVTLVR